jgi:hypothetical protein
LNPLDVTIRYRESRKIKTGMNGRCREWFTRAVSKEPEEKVR